MKNWLMKGGGSNLSENYHNQDHYSPAYSYSPDCLEAPLGHRFTGFAVYSVRHLIVAYHTIRNAMHQWDVKLRPVLLATIRRQPQLL